MSPYAPQPSAWQPPEPAWPTYPPQPGPLPPQAPYPSQPYPQQPYAYPQPAPYPPQPGPYPSQPYPPQPYAYPFVPAAPKRDRQLIVGAVALIVAAVFCVFSGFIHSGEAARGVPFATGVSAFSFAAAVYLVFVGVLGLANAADPSKADLLIAVSLTALIVTVVGEVIYGLFANDWLFCSIICLMFIPYLQGARRLKSALPPRRQP